MNKAEYKKISHDIRYAAFRDARYRTEKTGKKHTTSREDINNKTHILKEENL